MISISAVNDMSVQEFTDNFAHVFEHSPWVAERAHVYLPFQSLVHLHSTMMTVVDKADRNMQLDLLRAHPELAGNLKQGEELTADSANEQRKAGLDQCTAEQLKTLNQSNHYYRKKFDFPFIVAVKGLGVEDIINTLMERTNNSYEDEFRNALQQVYKIAEFRLKELINSSITL
jgi:2-oxo-4-hydroxy-4-carboxy-5-ureidoimidazoline decarboxylase